MDDLGWQRFDGLFIGTLRANTTAYATNTTYTTDAISNTSTYTMHG